MMMFDERWLCRSEVWRDRNWDRTVNAMMYSDMKVEKVLERHRCILKTLKRFKM